MVTMPRPCASCGLPSVTSRPSNAIVPASGTWAPARILSRVDLPAPFSPSSAITSPRRTSKSTPCSACTPGKLLLIPDMRRRGSTGAVRRTSWRRWGSPAGPGSGGRLLHLVEPLGLVEIGLGDDDRRQQDEVLVGLLLALEIVDHDVHGLAALAARELLDGSGERAVADRGQRFRQGVEADDLDLALQVARLDGLQGAERHVVVGGDDHVGRARHAGEQRLGDREALVAGEVRGLLGQHLVLVLVLVDDVVQALVAVDGRRGAGLALQVDDLGPVRVGLEQPVALGLAALDVVGTDVGQDALHARHPAVDGHDRDAVVGRGLDRRRHGVDVERADDDPAHALHHRGLDVRGLLRGGVLPVALDRLHAELLRLVLQLLHHVDEEREAEARHRGHDGDVRGPGPESQHPGDRGAGERRRELFAHDLPPWTRRSARRGPWSRAAARRLSTALRCAARRRAYKEAASRGWGADPAGRAARRRWPRAASGSTCRLRPASRPRWYAGIHTDAGFSLKYN